jgi:lipopolysaccharide heptosyltransferase II
MNLGVFLPNWIGDVVMATPCLRALRRHLGPLARIVGIMRPGVADVLDGTRWLDEQLIHDPQAKTAGLRGWRFVRRLRQERFDMLLLLSNSLRTGLLAAIGGAGERIGYVRYGRGPLLTGKLPPPRRDGRLVRHPMVNYYLELAYAVGCPREEPRLELATTPGDELAADSAWRQLGLRDGRVIVLNSSGAFGAAKLWPVEYSAGLGRRAAEELDHDVLVLCGPNERESARQIVRMAGHPRVVSLADQPLGIGLSKACVRRSRLMVTTDSGPRHFAVAFGVPLVTLFGPTPPIWGQNPLANEVRLSVPLECLGCHARTCPLRHHRCMRDLSVDVVHQAVARHLEQGVTRAA